MINVTIHDHEIKAKVDVEVLNGIKMMVQNSPALRSSVDAAIASVRIDTTMVEAAIKQAITNVCNSPGFLDGLIKSAILSGSEKLGGSFDASLRAAGKKLAMDTGTLEKVADGVKAALVTEAESRLAEYELRGGGSFA